MLKVSNRIGQQVRVAVEQLVVAGRGQLGPDQFEAAFAAQQRAFVAQLAAEKQPRLPVVDPIIEVHDQRGTAHIADEDSTGRRYSQFARLLRNPVHEAVDVGREIRWGLVLRDLRRDAIHSELLGKADRRKNSDPRR